MPESIFPEEKLGIFLIFIELSSMTHFNLADGKYNKNFIFHIFTSVPYSLHNVQNSKYHVMCFQSGNFMFDVS